MVQLCGSWSGRWGQVCYELWWQQTTPGDFEEGRKCLLEEVFAVMLIVLTGRDWALGISSMWWLWLNIVEFLHS